MKTHYKLRITLSSDVPPEAAISCVDKYSSCYAFVLERGKVGERPHYHFYYISDKKEGTIRNGIRKMTGSCKGNQLFSMKQLDCDDGCFAIQYLAYMMKEGDVKYVGEWDDKVVAEAKTYDDKVKLEMKEKKEKKKGKYQRILEAFEAKFPDKRDTVQIYQVVQFMIEFYSTEEGMVSSMTIESYCNSLLIKYNIGNYRNIMSQRIIKRLLPDNIN